MKILSAICFIFLVLFISNKGTCSEGQIPLQAQEVLSYWFGSIETAEDYPSDKAEIWFNGGKEVDDDIRSKFGHLVIAATNNELNDWRETPSGRLALIILVDQFTRNIFRGTPEAFAYDSLAQELTLEGLELEDDLALLPVERAFFYLPLEHAEDLDLQTLSVSKFHSLIDAAPVSQRSHFIGFANYAQSHYDVIAKFGRFPHRNEILGRETTEEEASTL